MKSYRQFLCWFLTVLMLLSPNAWVMAQEIDEDTATLTEPIVEPSPDIVNTPNERGWLQNREDQTLLADPAIVPVPDVVDTPLEVTHVLPQACLVATARPQAILASPMCKMMPIEVIQAASIQYTGIDALLMDRVIVSVEPPIGGPPNYAVTASFTAPVAGKLHPQIVANLEKQAQSPRPHFKSSQPLEPSLYFPKDNVILATPEATLQRFLADSLKPGNGEILQRLKDSAKDDLYVGIDFVPLRPLVNMALMQTSVPPQLQHFYTAPDLIKTIELRLNISHAAKSELIVESNSPDDAEKLEQIVLMSIDLVKAEVVKEVERMKANPDPVQQAMGRYQERVMNETARAFLPQREENKLVVFRLSTEGSEADAMMVMAASGILLGLLLPAVHAAREAARRNASMNNMKQIMLALLNYENAHKSFPAHANYSADGKPLLSWRVHILPYMEQQALYNQFHLNEPWDSEHNKKLISTMPEQYIDPSSGLTPAEGRTHYLGVKGAGMVFNGREKGTAIRDITDGTSNTIAVVQVNDDRAAPWTKPDDWEMDPQNVMKGLSGSMHPGVFVAGYVDGSVRNISEGIDRNVFKGFLTIAGEEPVQNP